MKGNLQEALHLIKENKETKAKWLDLGYALKGRN